MTPNDQHQFDDPCLKAAIRRTWGGERTPADLRQRIEQLLAEAPADEPADESLPSPSPLPLHALRRWVIGAAAAIVLAVGGGLIVNVIAGHGQLAPAMLANLVYAHQKCCQGPACGSETSPADFAKLGRTICGQLNRPVLSANLVDDGWTFQSGGVCPACGQKAAHLLFKRDGQTLSVFSTRAPAGVHDGATFVGRIDNHSVAARVEHGMLFCFVGQGAGGHVSPDQLEQLLKMHRAQVVESAVAQVAPMEMPH